MKMNPPVSSPCELTLECRPSAKRSYTVLNSQIGDETQNLQNYLQALEKERLKIEVFKRELPFSMQLLNDAIETSEQLLGNSDKLKSPIKEEQNGLKSALQEFIPVNKTNCEEPADKESHEIEVKGEAAYAKDDIPNWMSSAQLWSHNHESKQTSGKQQDSHPQQTFPLHHRVGGAFLPFSRERKENPRCPDPGLSSGGQEVGCLPISSCKRVVSLKNKTDKDDNGLKETFEVQDEGIPKTDGANPNPNTSPNDCQRKPRRCWSPELHRKFVDALQQLGGSQATPKQIRELMKVDGLTNDEVKSHLQKYRLHTRRLSPSCVSSIPQPQVPPQLVVVGGIWVHPEHAGSRGQGLYAALPGHYYCQPSNSAIGVEEFCSQRINTSVYEMQEEHQGSPQSWGMGDYAKSKSFDMNEELQESEKGNGEITRKFGMGLSK